MESMAKSDTFANSSKERFQIGETKQVNLSIGGSFDATHVGTTLLSTDPIIITNPGGPTEDY
jgi:hypothetical protein